MLANYPDEAEATALATALSEAVSDHPATPHRDDDGLVRAPHLQRVADRLFMLGEPHVWFDVSPGDGAPSAGYDSEASLPHEVRHQDAPMTEYHGWHQTADGWLLISSDGTSWQPEAHAPEDR
jgi:hypothetical protein